MSEIPDPRELIRDYEAARKKIIELLRKEKPGYADWWYERHVDTEERQ